MRLAALCSGGKDSAYALWLALEEGHDIDFIVSMIPERSDSWMFHRPNVHLMDLFAECSKIPLIKGETSGVKEKELDDLKLVLSNLEVDGIVNGAVASNYQKNRIDGICEELGLSSVSPLWNKDPLNLLRGIIKEDFEVIITSVSAMGLGKNWLGRKLNEESLQDLKDLRNEYGINISGEGGEYETLVLNTPFFENKRISIIETRSEWKSDSGKLIVEKAEIVS
ncbi:MAG: TIGR00289 family protein [Hadesarchaea archaeon]|nr:TIGR00289 family protein [Hadesarchaea archaeon]